MTAPVPDRMIECAKQTCAICAHGSYVAPSGATIDLRERIDDAVARTTLLRERDLELLVTAKRVHGVAEPHARVACWDLRSGACAQRLLTHDGAARVAVLNYANGVRPGGGFLHGSRAQEEALCRCSALYACLSAQRESARAYYVENDAAKSALVTGHVLVSPDVPFFRDEELALLDAPFAVTVLTAAAPDLGWLHATTSEQMEPMSRYDDVPGVFRARAQYVLAAAHHAGCDAIVAGPWGCGAFGNKAEVVADAFAHALDLWRDAFRFVIFSTYGPPKNREPFQRRFTM